MAGSNRHGWRRLLTIEDTFAIRDRGVVVVPEPRLDEAVGGTYEAELRRPDGSVLPATLELVYAFPVPTPPVRRWTQLLRGVEKQDVPIGAEVWVPPVPQHLASTYALLRRAYGGGIPAPSVLPVLRVLTEHMSHRNLADVLHALWPEHAGSWLNEIYRASELALDHREVCAALDHLRARGFDEWLAEP